MKQTTPIGDAAVRFIAATPGRSHAPEVLDAAKMCLVDWFGVALGAAKEPAARAVRRVAENWSPRGRAHILLGPAVAPSAAALTNATMAYCAALGLSGYAAVEGDFSEIRLRDPALRALIAKSEVAVQPGTELTEGFVEVHLADGRALRADVPLALGNPGNPMSWAAMQGKFAALVEPVLGDETRSLFEALRRFEEPATLAKVMATVTRAAH